MKIFSIKNILEKLNLKLKHKIRALFMIRYFLHGKKMYVIRIFKNFTSSLIRKPSKGIQNTSHTNELIFLIILQMHIILIYIKCNYFKMAFHLNLTNGNT